MNMITFYSRSGISTWFFMLIFLSNSGFCQKFEIEGRVINKNTNKPIEYANIYNKSTFKGTISNTDGYFRIAGNGFKDTILIKYIGYKDEILTIQKGISFYSVKLNEIVYQLSGVTVTPKDNSYLYELITNCRKHNKNVVHSGKSYYEVKSYIDEKQIELLEGFYNTKMEGYSLIDLELKAGRLAIKPYDSFIYASLESSRSITMLDIFNGNENFPTNPIELPKNKLRKMFYLKLDRKYIDNANDSIFIIEYSPKKQNGYFFHGKLWVNNTKKYFIKATLNCDSAAIHPFIPIFTEDTISTVRFNITMSFLPIENQTIFNHIDYNYILGYKSYNGKTFKNYLIVNTKALLHIYEFDKQFFQPIFNFPKNIGDYRKISAFPFNDFFWECNTEYHLNDSINSNEMFFLDINNITNKNLFKAKTIAKQDFFEHSYVSWSEKRINFREIFAGNPSNYDSTKFNNAKVNLAEIQSFSFGDSKYASAHYNLDVKIFIDYNFYNDSANIITSTIIDPYTSYYRIKMDNKSLCFINLYFDLCEIQRRELEIYLKNARKEISKIRDICNEFKIDFENKKNKFMKEVQRGTNEEEMKKYNVYVREKLGIDNINIYKPYSKDLEN